MPTLLYVYFNIPSSISIIQLTSSSGLEQRDYVIRELIDTESNYIDVLKSLREKFMMPMKSHLSREEINIIFPKINVRTHVVAKIFDKID